MKLPFKVGKPVEEECFIDRENEIKELKKYIKFMSNTCLLGMENIGQQTQY